MTKPDKIKIELNKDEALVLFEFLARFNDSGVKDIYEDQAEQKMLWIIQGQLEVQLTEMFVPNYKDIIQEARTRIRDLE